MLTPLRRASLLALLIPLGCGPTAGFSGNNNQGNAGPADAGAGQDGQVLRFDGGNADAGFDPDAGCGSQTEEIGLINLGDPPDLLIVLDRSGSMMLAPGFPPFGTSKWVIMRDALTQVTQARENNIRFGLSVFPTDNDCGVAPGAVVDIALGNAQPISDWLSQNSPDGNTPAHFGLQEALAYYATLPVNPAGRYVLFATDGLPNCGGSPPSVDIDTNIETVDAVTQLFAVGIPTFVLGFGDILGLDPGVLNDAALAGGVPKPGGPPHFYHADNAADLQAALDTIAGGIIVPTCSYQLASLPPVPDDVTVYIDGVAVPRSTAHTNGWDYWPDQGTITFFGSYCDQIEAGSITSVNFSFGCPGPVVD